MKHDLQILIVEDDKEFLEEVIELLGVYNEIQCSGSIAEARAKLQKKSFDVVILDKNLPDGNGTNLIAEIKDQFPHTVIIILTVDRNFGEVNRCLEAGADDYVTKSHNIVPELLVRIPLAIGSLAVKRKSEQLAGYLERIVNENYKYEIIGRSAVTANLRATIHEIKGSRASVLITGETGTGKELIARRINAIEEKKPRPFVAINCGAIPENLVESELFGHKRGGFTGATSDKMGLFELANGGDIFLDEVGELPLSTQVRLLRVIQTGEFYRVGCTTARKTSVRVIAATNQQLEQMVTEKKFREDLYYRLNVHHISTIPLRERSEDIEDIARFFVLQLEGPRFSISDEALQYLVKLEWPGNVRELHNAVERALLRCKSRKSTKIDRTDFRGGPIGISLKTIPNGLLLPKQKSDLRSGCFEHFMEAAEREYLKAALALCDDSAAETANLLGLGRSTIFKKLNQLGLSKPKKENDVGTTAQLTQESGYDV